MRLGVCGMLPEFRSIQHQHLEAIRALGLTGAAYHVDGQQLFDVTTAECERVRTVYAEAGMDQPQFAIGFGECLFDPDSGTRDYLITKIKRGVEVARQVAAFTCLIRTGSLNPSGSYSPCRENHEPASRERLVDTLKKVAAKAEEEGVTVILETHALTIMGSPEINKAIIEEVGSARMGVVMDYVNHFQSMAQVWDSTARLNHIFDHMGPISPLGHCKDLVVKSGLVLHIDEAIPGDGELDMVTALQRWQEGHPDDYMLLEHLANDRYPRAASNVRRICEEAGIEIH